MRFTSILIVSTLFFLSIFFPVHALTPKEEKWVITLKSPSLAYKSPEWLNPFVDISEAPTDIDYRKSILPRNEYRDEAMYIVLPTLGIISPVVEVPAWTSDFENMMWWEEIDINKYLNDWVMFYPWTAPVGSVWNPVIFGHSNFFRAGDGNFKTIFADIMNLDVWVDSEMRVYRRKPWQLDYDKYRYEITQSYETTPEDVWILQPQWGRELTVFACTNWLEWRRILRGRLIEDDEVLITFNTRIRVKKLLERMRQLDASQQAEITEKFGTAIVSVSKRLPETLETYEDKYLMYVLRWMKWVVN